MLTEKFNKTIHFEVGMLARAKLLFLALVVIAICVLFAFQHDYGKSSMERSPATPKVEYWQNENKPDEITPQMKLQLEGDMVLTLWDFKQRKKLNEMKIRYNNCTRAAKPLEKLSGNAGERPNEDDQFIIVTNFAYLNPRDRKNDNLLSGGLKINETILHFRNMEIMNVLASNLNHRFIKEIHILVQEPQTADYLRHLPLRNSHKVVIQVMGVAIEMNTQFKYAGRCLKDQIVAVSHQDNMFGEGWEKLQPDILRKRKLMYALTRHTSATVPCSGSKLSANCDPGYPYIGSHDIFMFHVKGEFTPEELRPLDTVTPNLYGMENLLIWLFRTQLKYTVINPCPVLVVYHQHCIALRGGGRRRVNVDGRSAMASFTQLLE